MNHFIYHGKHGMDTGRPRTVYTFYTFYTDKNPRTRGPGMKEPYVVTQ